MTGHDAERWERVSALLEELLELAPGLREARLSELDDDVRSEVRSLLEADAAAGDEFLAATTADRSGVRVGAYRILSELGRGGMGRVYLAERADDAYAQQVALKIVRSTLASPELVERFHQERRILARLEHPNIARLLDAGTTPDGLPYVVMEYVDGEPLDDFVRGRSVRERLELVVTVCRAVQFAHANLVVHRDLKPANILVAEGTPKLLDFGIAKLLGDEDAGLTRTLERPMTLEYASPEQVRGDPVTTASDVYALGLLLYRVLTGRAPFLLEGLSASQIERVVCEEEAPRPRSVVGNVPRDLELIVMKALRKEPERRYASAEQLAEDLERFQAGLTIRARPETVGYRARKFVARNRWPLAAVTLLFAAVIGGLVAARAERDRAERLFTHARTFARATLFEIHPKIRALPGATPARRELVESALTYLEGVSAERGDDPELRLEIAQAYVAVAGVQGNPHESNLGDSEGALTNYRLALTFLEGATGKDAGLARGVALEGIADILQSRGEVEEAVRVQERAVAVYRATPGLEQIVASGLLKLGDRLGNPNYRNAGRFEEAAVAFAEALEIGGEGGRFGIVLHDRIGTLHAQAGRIEEALEAYRFCNEVAKRQSALAPDDHELLHDLAVSHEKIGNCLRARWNLVGALEEYDQAYEGYRAIYEGDPQNANARRSLTVSMEKRASMLRKFRKRDEAREVYLEIIGHREALVELDPGNQLWADDLARAKEGLAKTNR